MTVRAGGREQAFHHQRIDHVVQFTTPIFGFGISGRHFKTSRQDHRARFDFKRFRLLKKINRINRAGLFALATQLAVFDVEHGFLRNCGRKRYPDRSYRAQVPVKC